MATIEMSIGKKSANFFRRNLSLFSDWVGNSLAIKALEIGSIAMILVMAIFTASLLSGQQPKAEPLSPSIAASLLVANLLPATLLLVLFGRRLALQRATRVHLGNRQRLHVRLVAIFSMVAAVPTLLLVIFASFLFQSGAQFWFSGSARGMLENAGELAQGYYAEKQRDISDETSLMAGDLRKALTVVDINDPRFFNAYIDQVLTRKLNESAIITLGSDGTQQSQAVISLEDKPKDYQWLDKSTLEKLANGEKLVVITKANKIEAVTRLYEQPISYLYTSRAQYNPIFSLGKKAQSVLSDYRAMEIRSRALQLQFNAALYLVSLLIIAVTVWIALIIADRLVRPITNLVTAAQNIADGDLTARVPEDLSRSDEVELLSKSFNMMTDQLENQTSTLLATNRQLDERRNFIEAVLESVSAGIISLDSEGTITLANSTAEKLLHQGESSIIGEKFRSVAPLLADIVDAKQVHAVVQMGDGPDPLTLAVKFIAGSRNDVVTFEDISQQLADQRRAAWSDVARRIAHEIKNPLTPIQLAAERLQRRFGKQITEGEAIFEQLTGTIVRQVGDLRNIVDEFSAFARMPKPVFKTEDIADIIGHSMFLLEVGHPDIQFEFTPPKTLLSLVCDRRQLGQAITNILKNAVESIEESSSSVTGKIFINLTQADSFIQISVTDNGPGLPADRERILEPYVTTRQTGSGLGLAIVQKIIEEHFAEIRIEDALGGGAVVTMQFSPDLIAERTQQAPEI
jgi:two-component system, NtrC family, nitrogen regulation sensor histidine kinase NtrY